MDFPLLPFRFARGGVTAGAFDVGGDRCQEDLAADAHRAPEFRYVAARGFVRSSRSTTGFRFSVPTINEKLSRRPVDLGVPTITPEGGLSRGVPRLRRESFCRARDSKTVGRHRHLGRIRPRPLPRVASPHRQAYRPRDALLYAVPPPSAGTNRGRLTGRRPALKDAHRLRSGPASNGLFDAGPKPK